MKKTVKKPKKQVRPAKEAPRSDVPGPGRKVRELVARYDTVIVFILLFLAYNTVSGIGLVSGDVAPASFLPASLLVYHNLYFDWAGSFYSSPDYAYAFPLVNGHYVSLFPIVTPVLVTPVYGISYILCTLFGIPAGTKEFLILAKTSASILAALAGVFLFLTAKELFSRKIAILTTFIFAFATSTWSISSQALWQHGMAELLLAAMIYLVVRNEQKEWPGYVFLLGILSGLYVFNRPPDFILLLPVLAYCVWFRRSTIPHYFAGALAGGLPFLLYNWMIFGSVFGGYAENLALFSWSLSVLHVIGMLVSPNAGLFIFSPILLVSVLGFFTVYRSPPSTVRTILIGFAPAIVLQILMYSLFFWVSSVFCYGPRYLTDFTPVLCICLGFFLEEWFGTAAPHREQLQWLVAAVVALLIIVSVVIQFIGAFLYIWSSNENQMVDDARAWNWSDSLIVKSYSLGSRGFTDVTVYILPPLPPLIEYHIPSVSPPA